MAVIDVVNALSNGAACVWDIYPDNRCFHFEKGDSHKVKEENENAAHVIKHQLTISRVTAAALEPRAIRASFDNASGKYRLEVGPQTPNRIRPDLAIALGIEPDTIEIIAEPGKAKATG